MLDNLTQTDKLILALYMLAQIADIYTTVRGLKLQNVREANGIVAWLMRKLGNGWIAVKLAVGLGTAYVIIVSGEQWMLIALTVFFFALAAWNYRIIRRFGKL